MRKDLKTLDIEEKLKSIEAICRSEAKAQKESLEKQVNSKIHESIQEIIDEFKLKENKKKISTLVKMEKEYNANLWQLEKEYKQKYLQQEDIIKNNLFEELKVEMMKFTKSKQYVDYLLKNINKTLSKFSEKQNLTIYVTAHDQSKISHIYANTKILDDKYIGGCIVENGIQSINNTLLENLEEKIDEYKNSI